MLLLANDFPMSVIMMNDGIGHIGWYLLFLYQVLSLHSPCKACQATKGPNNKCHQILQYVMFLRILRLPARQAESAKQRGAVTGDDVADRVHGVFPLLLGMEREDRCG